MPTLDPTTVARAAEALLAAERSRVPIAPLTETYPGIDAADGYAIQQRVVAARVAEGERIVGWKLGLTSRAMQAQLGIDQPDYSAVLSGQLLADGGAIRPGDLIQPRVEAEIAFVLRAPLRGPGVTVADVLAATSGISPAIETIDSRIEAWRIGLADTIADLASCARVTLGPCLLPVDGLDTRLLGCVLERNGEVVGTGAGAAALGSPVAAVAWAANTLGPLGITLEAGQFLMTGGLHASVPAAAGDTFTATIDRLGSVRVRFA